MSSDLPYGLIVQEFAEGRLVPFLGPEINVTDRSLDAPWTIRALSPPSSLELSRYLVKQGNLPDGDEVLSTSLVRRGPSSSESLLPQSVSPQIEASQLSTLAAVSSYYARRLGRLSLEESLYELYGYKHFSPSRVHRLLALIGHRKPLLIITTGYDDLIERAFEDANCPFHIVSTLLGGNEFVSSVIWWDGKTQRTTILPADQLFIDLSEANVIYKINGTANPRMENGTCVITEEDYLEFLCQMWNGTAIPTCFLSHLRTVL